MNRFNRKAYSQFKNSLVTVYLSLLDALRPRYFLLENVANMASYFGGQIFRLLLRMLSEMGYQFTAAVLQAGQYGVPQSRTRTILLAAAPGYPLPRYPAAVHTFAADRADVMVRSCAHRPSRCRACLRRAMQCTCAAQKSVFVGYRRNPKGGLLDKVQMLANPRARTTSGPLRMVRARELFTDLPDLHNADCADATNWTSAIK